MNASANAARRIYLCEKDGPLFFKFLKENHGWKTANIKLHGSVYCTDTFVSKKQARINENFFTKLDFVDQVNADQARFRSKIERFHKWCRGSESSSDDDEKENEVTTVAGCGEDVDETKSHSSQSTVVTPQQPPKKRGRASDVVPRTAMSATTTAPIREVKTAARAERPKNTRAPTPLASRQTNNNMPARTKALPSDTEAEVLLNVRTYASELCEALTRLVERRINWRTLLQDKNVLVDVTTRNIEEIVAVVKRYDNHKQERSIGGALAQIEAQLKTLAAAGTGRPFVEEDENVARVLLELLDSVLDKTVGSSGMSSSSSSSSRAHPAPAQTASDTQTEKQSSNSRLPTEARTWGHQLCNVLQVVVEQQSRRHSLERDNHILTDVTNGNIEAIVDAVKRSGCARSIGEALVFIEKELQTRDNARALFVQRDMELLQRLRKLLRKLFCS